MENRNIPLIRTQKTVVIELQHEIEGILSIE